MTRRDRKRKTQVWIFAKENRYSCHLGCIHHQVCLQMCSQYTAHSEAPTASAADSFTYTDTHPQASYHTVPTHRYISVIYYVTSAEICDSWHTHPLTVISTHTDTASIVNAPVLKRVRVISHPNSHDAKRKCETTPCF